MVKRHLVTDLWLVFKGQCVVNLNKTNGNKHVLYNTVHPSLSSSKSYQEMCRQLDALLASSCPFTQPEIKRCPRTPTAELPQDWSHNWPAEPGCDSTAHGHTCNKLQEVHSSQLISAAPCHVIDPCTKRTRRTSTTKNNYSHCTYNAWPWKQLSSAMNCSKEKSDDYTPRSQAVGVIVAKLSAAKVQSCKTSGSCF